MSKTPEEMAEEYCYKVPISWFDRLFISLEEIRIGAFKSGYQAAQLESIRPKTDIVGDALNSSAARHAVALLADASKVMNSPEKQDSCEHILDMEKMVDVNPFSGWISVKDRLPEHGVPVLVFDTLANTIELMSWDKIMEVFETDDAYFVQLNDASHWMPLPKPPEEK